MSTIRLRFCAAIPAACPVLRTVLAPAHFCDYRSEPTGAGVCSGGSWRASGANSRPRWVASVVFEGRGMDWGVPLASGLR